MPRLLLLMHLPILGVAATAASAAVLPSRDLAIRYSTSFVDAFLQRGIPANNRYDTAVFYRSVELTNDAYKNDSYPVWLKAQLEGSVTPNGTIIGYPSYPYSLDDIRIGQIFLLAAGLFPEDSRYKTAADTLRRQLNSHPRTPSGGFWHRDPTYPSQMWLDGIYMADVFYAHYTALFDGGNTTAWDDILLQFSLIESRTYKDASGLLVHGYDESRKAVWADPVNGAAPNVWDRALGWWLMALVDVLDVFPKEHGGYETLICFFQSAAIGILQAQDTATGG